MLPSRAAVVVGLLLAALAPVALAQELDARTYANAPVGMNFVGVAVAYSEGNVLLDRSLPIEDMDAKISVLGLRYTRTFAVAGKAAKFKVVVPYSTGHWEGLLEGEFRERDASGMGDTRFTFEVNFSGAPALTPKEFAGYRQKTIVGASLAVTAPTGKYEPDRLINLGSNRWGFRPQVGVSRAVGKWVVEAAVTAWVFTQNSDFYGGSTLDQGPLFALQVHGIRNFRRGFWLGFGVASIKGGRTTLNGEERDDQQVNTRAGIRLSYPLSPHHGLGLDISTGVATNIGAEFDSVALAYQYLW